VALEVEAVLVVVDLYSRLSSTTSSCASVSLSPLPLTPDPRRSRPFMIKRQMNNSEMANKFLAFSLFVV
jgi:hypothetical protein